MTRKERVNLYQKVMETIEKNKMLEKGDRVIIGVSGGADSIALADFLCSVQEQFFLGLTVVHIHHGIRGKEADDDKDFVKAFCEKKKIECLVFYHDIPKEARSKRISEEEAGRQARYEDFEAVAQKKQANKIAVAHNKNDQAETLFMRLCRGSGMKGFGGILPKRGKIIRPFLDCTRQEIEQYCKKRNLDFCIDSTNSENQYTRNKIRNQLIPWLEKEINTETVDHIVSMSEQMREENIYLEKIADSIYQKAKIKKNFDSILLCCETIKEEDAVIQRRVLKQAIEELKKNGKNISMRHIQAIRELIEKPTGKGIDLIEGIKAKRVYDGICIYQEVAEQENLQIDKEMTLGETIFIKELGKFVEISSNENKNGIKKNRMCTKVFDYDKIKNSIHLRTRKPGDRIYFRGIGGNKKLKDYFIDEKIPREERSRILLIADGSDILWVMGYRVSDWYLAEENTKNIVTIQTWEDV